MPYKKYESVYADTNDPFHTIAEFIVETLNVSSCKYAYIVLDKIVVSL